MSYQEFFLPILLHISNVYFSGTKVTHHSWELCKKNVYSLEHLDWLKIPGLKSFCKPYSKKCRFIIWRLYQFNGTKNFKRCFCQKNIFFLSQLTCWLSSTNLITRGTLGLCCAHIARLMTLQQFCAWLFTLQLCY